MSLNKTILRMTETVRLWLIFRKDLYQFHPKFNNRLEHIENLTGDHLSARGIELLALDFDGVLSHHGAHKPSESVLKWLNELNKKFPLSKICLYSNNIFDKRIDFFHAEFPEIEIIPITRKKPNSNDLSQFIKQRHLFPKQVLVIDDRLTSGILAACAINANALLLNRPKINFQEKTIKECFYFIVRKLERLMICIYSAKL